MQRSLRRFVGYQLAFITIVASTCHAEIAARIDYIAPAKSQPHENSDSTIWFDDFDTNRIYFEPAANSRSMRFSESEKLGQSGRSMECRYPKGQRGIGGRKVIFGDAPFQNAKRSDEKFDEIFWRYYVKYQPGWKGGGEAKHSRAIVFTSRRWTQASILHLWTSRNRLTLDPVCAVEQGRVASTKYNDFASFKWLGNSPRGKFSFYSDQELGRWVCVEAHWKLNTPGKPDGIARLWVDGELDAERTNMNFRDTYDRHGINAVFLESYWNDGSPVNQTRWLDNFVIATEKIGPVAVSFAPIVVPKLSSNASDWQVEIIEQSTGATVFRSIRVPANSSLTVDQQAGEFVHPQKTFAHDKTYVCRIRETSDDSLSQWSPLHWPFRVSN